MPRQNGFRHQSYDRDDGGSHELLVPGRGGEAVATTDWPRDRSRVGSDSTVASAATISERLHRAGVRRVYLVHGTFAGDDGLGLIRNLAWVWPEWGRQLRAQRKRLFDQLLGDAGNFTERFAEELEAALRTPGSDPPHSESRSADRAESNDDSGADIPVRRWNWSSENHHVARAAAAVRLIRTLDDEVPNGRVLLWGHSHGGNVLAIVTNLLGASRESLAAFFAATAPYSRCLPPSERFAWRRVAVMLEHGQLADRWKLDIATFGTPIRYGWDTGACDHLLHFVNHRPLDVAHPARAALPMSPAEVLGARGGDYIQQIGIAGTNFPPSFLEWTTWRTERRLQRLLQGKLRKRDLPTRLAAGKRVHADGHSLLVDYYRTANGRPSDRVDPLAGHAVYTRLEWLPFHLAEIATRFYP